MHLDKKSIKGKPRFVIIEAIGSALSFNSHYCTLVETPLLMTALKWMNDALHCD
jgi:3-dehydroquinate synthetase